MASTCATFSGWYVAYIAVMRSLWDAMMTRGAAAKEEALGFGYFSGDGFATGGWETYRNRLSLWVPQHGERVVTVRWGSERERRCNASLRLAHRKRMAVVKAANGGEARTTAFPAP